MILSERSEREILLFKGMHPGLVLDRKLQDNKMSQRQLALMIREHPQTISNVITGKRNINLLLSLKIELALGMDEGYFMILQIFHDIRHARVKMQNDTPDVKKFTKLLFADIDIKSLDWFRNASFIIRRVLERGYPREIEEITKFYGQKEVNAMKKKLKNPDFVRVKERVWHGYIKKSPL